MASPEVAHWHPKKAERQRRRWKWEIEKPGSVGIGGGAWSIASREAITVASVRWQEWQQRAKVADALRVKNVLKIQEKSPKISWPMLGLTLIVSILPCGTI